LTFIIDDLVVKIASKLDSLLEHESKHGNPGPVRVLSCLKDDFLVLLRQ
jgi:hypothetical protein